MTMTVFDNLKTEEEKEDEMSKGKNFITSPDIDIYGKAYKMQIYVTTINESSKNYVKNINMYFHLIPQTLVKQH